MLGVKLTFDDIPGLFIGFAPLTAPIILGLLVGTAVDDVHVFNEAKTVIEDEYQRKTSNKED